MATSNHRASSHSTLFFGIAASASQVRTEKRNRIANRSGAHPIEARPPQTSLIDAEWDLEPFAPAVDETETDKPSTLSLEPQLPAPVSVRPPHTSLIDAEWEAIPDATQEPTAPTISIRAPRTTAIDEDWEPLTARTESHSHAPPVSIRAPRTTAIDEDWEPPTTRMSAESQALALLELANTAAIDEDRQLEFLSNSEEEAVVEAPMPVQAPRGRSVAAVTLAALLAASAFAAVQGYNFANRHRAMPHAAAMLHHAPLPNAGLFVEQHWNPNWLESGSTVASYASAALATSEAEAVAKPLPKKPVVYRRAFKAVTPTSQAAVNDVSAPAANTDGQPASSATPPTAADSEQAPAAPAAAKPSD